MIRVKTDPTHEETGKVQTLTLAQAQQIMAGALVHSRTAGYKSMGIAVLDEAIGIAGVMPAGLVAG